jgi:two-component system nitrogen regulation sensor histidine kinase NtrY
MIEQVLINLMNNAIYATKETENPFIKLKAFLNRDHQPILQITDNGSGIAEEIRESIFIPFFTTRKNGSGIGLSLARQIMHLHGGTITVQSSPGKETTFNLLFKKEECIEK